MALELTKINNWNIPSDWLIIKTLDAHTAGEPLRPGQISEISGLAKNDVSKASKIAQQIFDGIAAVMNSNEEADLSGGFKLNIIFAEMPIGGTGARRKGGPGSYHHRRAVKDAKYNSQRRSILNPAGKS